MASALKMLLHAFCAEVLCAETHQAESALSEHVSSCDAGFRLRAMLVHEVFDKVLYLTPSARAQFSSGRIFNLVTTDAETLQMLFQNILGVISSPFRIIGAMVMLYIQLGPSSLVALAVLILMMPVQVSSCFTPFRRNYCQW